MAALQELNSLSTTFSAISIAESPVSRATRLKDQFRPAHADYTYAQKYGVRDYRGGGRSSARETAMRVAAGAIAKKALKATWGVEIRGYLSQLGPIKVDLVDWNAVEENPFFCPDPAKIPELEEYMQALIKEGNSVGAKITESRGRRVGWYFFWSGFDCAPSIKANVEFTYTGPFG